MSLVLDRLGDAAFVLHDDATGSTLLLGCGELRSQEYADRNSNKRSGTESDEDGSVSSGNEAKYLTDLRDLLRRDAESTGPMSATPRVNAVLITDYRPESCYMLPFLTEKCGLVSAQQPQLPFPIVMTHATRALGAPLLAEYWSGRFSGKRRDNVPIYDVNDIHSAFRRANGIGLKGCVALSEHIKVTAYHAGHVLGGCMFYIQIGSSSVLYVNDVNMGGGRVILPAQVPRLRPTAMITRSSFAVTVSETRTAMERDLMRVIQECIVSDGKVILPVYRMGFVYELLTILLNYWRRMRFSCPIYLSDDVMETPGPYRALLRQTLTKNYWEELSHSTHDPQVRRFDWNLLTQPGSYVLITTPANISQGDSCRAIRSAAVDPKNLIVLSECCKPGSMNYMLYADPLRKEVSKRLGVTIACGVHYFPCGDELDTKSIIDLVRLVSPQQVFLDYVIHDDVQFVKAHIRSQLEQDSETSSMVVMEIAQQGAPMIIEPTRDIPLRIHKSMFNTPNDVQGMLIAEAKRKLVLVSTSNGIRRLKKKKHVLEFQSTWKKPFDTSLRVKKKSARASASALSFLLSAPAESADEDEPVEQPAANITVLDQALENSLQKWLFDIPMEKSNRWFKLRSVSVALSVDWEVHMNWSYDDEELAGRILGIAKQVIYSEYAKTLSV